AELAGIERMVGLLINTLPLRLRFSPQQKLIDLLRQVQDGQSRLMAHQHVGLTEIARVSGLSGELFDTLVVFENYPVERAGLTAAAAADGLRLTRVEGHDATHYALTLVAQPGEMLRLHLDWRPDLFDAGTVERLGGRLVRLLGAVAADAERLLGSIDILEGSERRTILERWNDTARVLPSHVTVGGERLAATLPSLCAAQAERTPEAVAVVCGERTLSYAALDA